MRFVLVCDCGKEDFRYDADTSVFICRACGEEYTEEEAGHELLGLYPDLGDTDDY